MTAPRCTICRDTGVAGGFGIGYDCTHCGVAEIRTRLDKIAPALGRSAVWVGYQAAQQDTCAALALVRTEIDQLSDAHSLYVEGMRAALELMEDKVAAPAVHPDVERLQTALETAQGRTGALITEKAQAQTRVAQLANLHVAQAAAAASSDCLHDDTVRQGAIWEVCKQCGKRWADDVNPRSVEVQPASPDKQQSYGSALEGWNAGQNSMADARTKAAIAMLDRVALMPTPTPPAAPVVTVDTPEFEEVLRHYYNTASSFMGSQPAANARAAVITHIDAHTDAAVARTVEVERTAKQHAIQQAQQNALEARTQRGTVLDILRHFGCPEEDWHALELIKSVPRYIRPEEVCIVGRAHDGKTPDIDMPIFGDGSKYGKRMFLVVLPAAQAPVVPNLTSVIHWLEGGCDPLQAAQELRGYQRQVGQAKAPVSAIKQAAPVVETPQDTPESMAESNARFAIDGAIQYGREDRNKPPSDDHWLMEYWLIGQQLRELGKTGWDNRTPLDPAEKAALAAPQQHAQAALIDDLPPLPQDSLIGILYAAAEGRYTPDEYRAWCFRAFEELKAVDDWCKARATRQPAPATGHNKHCGCPNCCDAAPVAAAMAPTVTSEILAQAMRHAQADPKCTSCHGAGVIGTPGEICPMCSTSQAIRLREAVAAAQPSPAKGRVLSREITDKDRIDFMDRGLFTGFHRYRGMYQVIWMDDSFDGHLTNGNHVRGALDAAIIILNT